LQLGHLKQRVLISGAAIALVLSACNVGAEPGAGDDLTLSIATPTDGAEVSLPFEVELESNVELGAPDTGNHHAHLYFDTDISSEDYDMVYGTTAEVTRELEPGEHTIIASLRNADHSDAGPSQEITVTVTAGDGDGGDASESEPASDPPSEPALPPGGDY
jgi:hypothetical protein